MLAPPGRDAHALFHHSALPPASHSAQANERTPFSESSNTTQSKWLAQQSTPFTAAHLAAQARAAAHSWRESNVPLSFRPGEMSTALGASLAVPIQSSGPGPVSALGKAPAFVLRVADLNPKISPSPAKRLEPRVVALAPMIEPIARRYQVDQALLMAIIHVESHGNPNARSHRGAIGLMQVMPRTGAHYGARDLFDKRQNVTVGARLVRDLMNRHQGRLDLVLAAYNAGSGAVVKYGGRIPPYPETQQYVLKVAAYHAAYRTLSG
ncbi:lytic transglycosylase domain-containing protein [Burkholderia ubonensis]|uniref:lytic transglycosylase domain-containing protein n=1 Tax=Burkholderia ubonensis TaxID=101571 RepID=UPI000AC18B9A|nr:lytic transglycosylase domain-containing protein [Burkholderia ubonensis]